MVQYFVLSFFFVFVVMFYLKFKNFMRAAFLGAVLGFSFLVLLGYFFPNYLCCSLFSVLMSIIVGIPGVLTIFIFNLFFC